MLIKNIHHYKVEIIIWAKKERYIEFEHESKFDKEDSWEQEKLLIEEIEGKLKRDYPPSSIRDIVKI